MVESELIKTNYLILLGLVEKEANLNNTIQEYFNYLNEFKPKFIDKLNITMKEELKEFLRGANRYSDEFSFSDINYKEIRSITNALYDILNN